MHVRDMQEPDIDTMARLLGRLARKYFLATCSPEQASTFVRENDAAALRRLAAGGYAYHVADHDGRIAGFIAVREERHVYHLFVDPDYHRRGIGRMLWEHAKSAAVARGGDGCFTVNSSNYAVAMYEALGFARTAPTQTRNGLQFNPMVFPASAARLVGAP